MNATEVLVREHRVIETVLDCLERMAEICSRDGALDADAAHSAIDFFRNFADRCHHAKEEDQLFTAMERRGFPIEGGPIPVMLAEHEQGRALVGSIGSLIDGAAAGDREARAAFVVKARSYVLLLREHIQKEDHCLFPMAENALDEEATREVLAAYEAVEREHEGVHEKYEKLADELVGRYGVTP